MSRHVLITGVSRGLGLAMARAALTAGWTVSGVSRQASADYAALQAEHGSRARFLALDLARGEAIKAELFEAFLPYAQPLHGVVNNAALAYDDLATNLDPGRLQAMYAVNVFAPMLVTKYAIRHMLFNQVAGSLVHLSSVCVHTGSKGLAMYASTKGALEAYSLNLAREWGERGIRSNCVAPGFVATAMSAGLSEEQRAKIYGRAALRRPTDPASVAATVLHLLGDGAASITGTVVRVDAGS
jgi:3-oxoacyl-[acyl-carrier protein] reductase